MSTAIPTIETTATGTAQRVGQNANDYKKYVVIDTNGVVVDAGQVFHGIDILKDENLEAKEEFFKQLFNAVGMEFKERSPQVKEVKKVNVSELLGKFAKGK